jgi:hypothetical protein
MRRASFPTPTAKPTGATARRSSPGRSPEDDSQQLTLAPPRPRKSTGKRSATGSDIIKKGSGSSSSSKKQRRSYAVDVDETEEENELDALRARNQALQAESAHYRSLVAVTVLNLVHIRSSLKDSQLHHLHRRGVYPKSASRRTTRRARHSPPTRPQLNAVLTRV